VRSPQKVTLLSLSQPRRQLTVYADEKLTTFLELGSAVPASGEALQKNWAPPD